METPSNTSIIGGNNTGIVIIVQGNTVGGNLNVNVVLSKSVDYAKLTKEITRLEQHLSYIPLDKPDERLEVSIDLETARERERQFKADVQRLNEIFSKINIDGERLTKAKEHFEAGRFREADAILDAEAMTSEQDALIRAREQKERELGDLHQNLTKNADEWLVKANINQLQWDDRDWFETTMACFEKSLKAQRTRDNLWGYALFLHKHNQPHKVEQLYLELLELVQADESDLATTAMNLGVFYATVQKMPEAEKIYLRSLEITERLAKANPAQFEPDLALTAMNLGVFYSAVRKMPEAETMFRLSLDIYERLAKANPAQFEPDLAKTAMNLGNFYSAVQNMPEAETMYLRSLEIRERLAKANSAQFEPDLAATLVNLGLFYATVQKMPEAEKMYLHSLEIFERLAKANPAQFEPNLARMAMNLGIFYSDVQNMPEAETMYLRSLEIYERLAKANPAQFEPDLARTAMNLGLFYSAVQKMPEAETTFRRALDICERLVKTNPVQFEPNLARTLGNLSWFYLLVKKFNEAQDAAERALALDSNQHFVRTNLGHSYLFRGDWPKAKILYETYLKNEKDPAAAKATLLKDLDDLEAAGISSPEVAQARGWLKE